MKLLSALVLSASLFAAVGAHATEICTGYDGNGDCTGWIDTDDGSYTPNVPGLPGNPGNPGSGCVCASYNDHGSCTYYVGCR